MQNKHDDYRLIREASHALVEEQVLREAGRHIKITNITLGDIDEISRKWKGRRYPWNWFEFKMKFRHIPYRFEMAIRCQGELCGVAIGKASRGKEHKRHVSAYFLEGNPDGNHPLKGLVAPIVIAGLERYAVMLGCEYIRLVNPLPEVLPRYRNLGFGEVARVPEGALYCERKC
jgi:hypothetical protein